MSRSTGSMSGVAGAPRGSKRHLWATAGAMAAALAWTSHALAADVAASADSATGVAPVTVTAERRETKLQETPVAETVTVPAGTYEGCLKMKEVLSDGAVEYKYYAKGVGCVRELPEGGDVTLKSHRTK